MNSLRRCSDHLSALHRRRKFVPKPPTIYSKSGDCGNKCSLIGEVIAPVRQSNFRGGDYMEKRVYTYLKVKDPVVENNNNFSALRILLNMRGELAEICLEYLKPKEFVYVFGHLCSYNKINFSGANNIIYKVEVCELNYIKMKNRNELSSKNDSNETSSYKEVINYEERNRDRLILWQIFFSNPFEWRDFRAKKPSKNYPDFCHKNSGEALWINPRKDPFWVKKQLELYDSKILGFKRFLKNSDKFDRWNMSEY